MTDDRKTFHLSAEEAEYFSKLTSGDSLFAALLGGYPKICVSDKTIILDPAGAEVLRDHLTERLARVGFDADYKLNKEGIILEKLIDSLYVPPRGKEKNGD
jgi:hypothetical protein